MEIDGFSIEKLRSKANELWDTIVKLETEKYDLEERQKRQDYDVSKKKRSKRKKRHRDTRRRFVFRVRIL